MSDSKSIARMPSVKPVAEHAVARLSATGGKALARSKAIIGQARRAIADARRNRMLIEIELYRGRYRHLSKIDDDLPVIRTPEPLSRYAAGGPRVASTLIVKEKCHG